MDNFCDFNLSNYTKQLFSLQLKRYIHKCSVFGFDPYLIKGYKLDELPTNVSIFDTFQYLVYKKSAYTQKEFKAWKSLEAFKWFESGWLKELKGIKGSYGFVVLGKVLHSQYLNLPPLKSWIHVSLTGIILSAHCDCVAGLAESCSHIGVILFALNSIESQENYEISVTEVKSRWVLPSAKIKIQQSNEEIFYGSRNADQKILHCPLTTINERSKILKKLIENNECPVSSLGLDEFLDEDIEIAHFLEFYMANLWKLENKNMTFQEIQASFQSKNFIFTTDQVKMIESNTRGQSDNEYWMKFRIGRITASIFKKVCRSKDGNFPAGLLNQICYPVDIHTTAINYGKYFEKKALKSVYKDLCRKHKKLKIVFCGIMILLEKNYYAASPDAILKCDCCGNIPVEVKCPYVLKNGNIQNYLLRKDCPIKLSNNEYVMDTSHEYYYQIQLQGYILKSNYVYFYIYSPMIKILVKEKVDFNFVENNMKKCDTIFKNNIYPEMLSKYFTNKKP